jgi:hypothetical protein
MKLDVFLKLPLTIFTLAPIFCSLLEAENISIGSRILPENERIELAHKREAGIRENYEKASSLKRFHELHYAAFHRILGFSEDNLTIELEDGSLWTLKNPADQSIAASWLPRDSIVIEQFGFDGTEYRILNQTSGTAFIAYPALGPVFQGDFTHWIVNIDSFRGSLKLEDGSEWVPYYVDDTLRWLPDDTVIVGAFESTGSYHAMLININLLDCVRFKLDNRVRACP